MTEREAGEMGEKGGTRAGNFDRLTLVPMQEKLAVPFSCLSGDQKSIVRRVDHVKALLVAVVKLVE